MRLDYFEPENHRHQQELHQSRFRHCLAIIRGDHHHYCFRFHPKELCLDSHQGLRDVVKLFLVETKE